jgi:hypothetical protein
MNLGMTISTVRPPGVHRHASHSRRGSITSSRLNRQGRGVYNTDYHEFQSRLGFAYQFRPSTVIRGGIGRFAAATFDTGGQNGFSRSTPFVTTQDNYTMAHDTLRNPFQNGVLLPTG